MVAVPPAQVAREGLAVLEGGALLAAVVAASRQRSGAAGDAAGLSEGKKLRLVKVKIFD